MTHLVTPVILTYNEESNINRSLASLSWADRVVILDSGSSDRTREISSSFPNVSWFSRSFDCHLNQWHYAIHDTEIEPEGYVLALDADMLSSPCFVSELADFVSDSSFCGALIPFEYRMLGQSLSGSIYPPQVRLFRRNSVQIGQSGHTQEFRVKGRTKVFNSKLIHDDQKPLDRWLQNQFRYAELEAQRIRSSKRPSPKDVFRKIGLSPVIWGVYAYTKAGGPLNSPASDAYAHERMIFESILARVLAGNRIGQNS